MHRSGSIVAAFAAAGVLLTGALSAVAQSPAVADSTPAAPAAALTGYRVVKSAPLQAAPRSQTIGTAVCPAGTVVVGGGAYLDEFTTIDFTINTSRPRSDGRTWEVFVNNVTNSPESFHASAECVAGVSNYSVVTGSSVNNPAKTQTSTSVSCPAGTVPLGGGGSTTSSSRFTNINSTIFTATGWRVDVNNASASAQGVIAYAVCGSQPAAYQQLISPAATVGAQSFNGQNYPCTGGRVALGGGVYSNSSSLRVNLYASSTIGSQPNDSSWFGVLANKTNKAQTESTYVVCAAATT